MRPDADHESWFVLVNAPRHGPVRRQRQSTGPRRVSPTRTPTDVLAVMARTGLDVRDRLLWREVRTPADLAHETRAPGGSIYGTSSNGARAAFLRPANRSPVPGLFLVGGSSHPGGGLPLVGMSAAIVAELIGHACAVLTASRSGGAPPRAAGRSRRRRDPATPPRPPAPSRPAADVDAAAEQEHRGDDHPGRPLPHGHDADLAHAARQPARARAYSCRNMRRPPPRTARRRRQPRTARRRTARRRPGRPPSPGRSPTGSCGDEHGHRAVEVVDHAPRPRRQASASTASDRRARRATRPPRPARPRAP